MQFLRNLGVFIVFFFAAYPAGAQWNPAASDVIQPIFRPLVGGGVLAHHNGILWAGFKDIWVSFDTGKSWQMRTPFDGLNNSCIKDIAFFDDNILLCTTQNGEVYTTQNQGLNWTQYIPTNPLGPLSIESARFAGSANDIVACSNAGDIYASRDGGNTWFDLKASDNFASDMQSGSGGLVNLIAGNSVSGSNLRFTTTAGAAWTAIGANNHFNWDSYSFARDECDTNIFYVANEDLSAKTDRFSRVFVSTDAGADWTAFDRQPLPYHCGSVSAATHAIYTQTFQGISRSTDHGRTWKQIGGPPNIQDTRFVTALSDNIVVAIDSGTPSGGSPGPGSVWVTYNSGGDSLSYNDGSNFSIQSADQKNDTLGGSVAVPISIGGIATPVDLELTVHYDTALNYLGTFSLSSTKLDIPGSSWKGRSRIFIPSANSSGILAHSLFEVFAGNLQSEQVIFDSILFCMNYAPAADTSIIHPPSGCGAATLSRFLRDSLLPQLRISPNPAASEFSIICDRDLGIVTAEIYDMLGIKRSESALDIKKNVPVKTFLPGCNGIYELRIKSPLGLEDFQIIVQR